MAQTDSIYDLFSKLCDRYSVPSKSLYKANYRSSCERKDSFSKKLKAKLYGVLLKFSNQSCSKTSSFVGSTEIDTLLSHVYMLRLSRQFDSGNNLETLLNKLRKSKAYSNDEIQACLRFLICLAGTGSMSNSSFGQDILPQIKIEKDDCCVFPMGPLQYGDSRLFRSSHHFMHYPREIFEQIMPFPSSENASLSGEKTSYQNALFEMPPGYDVNGNLLFKVSDTKPDDSGNHVEPLFGALFQKVRTNEKNLLSIQLKIPELSETFTLRPMDFRLLSTSVPSVKKESAETSCEDEGFIESPLSSTSTGSINEDIWETALKTKPKTWFSWETIGCYNVKKEKPFLTEAGGQVVDMLHQAHLHELYLLNPSFVGVAPITISQQCLIRAVLNLFIGVPSDIFHFSQDIQEFTVRSGIHVQGLTPDSMKVLLSDFVKAGTDYHRLLMFCDDSLPNSYNTTGLVLQALKGGLNQYLHYYQAAVLSFSQQEFTVLQLVRVFHRLMKQLRFLAHLCKLSDADDPDQSLPMGVDLLSYLYQCALEQSGHDNYFVMIFLLRSASLPYLKFLQDWVFEGVCSDPFGEFHVQSNDCYLNARDNSYWTKGYLLSSSDVRKCVPPFLHHVASDIFICGKTLNLLKICCPKHHLYHGDHKHPPLLFTFSEKTVAFISQRSKEYAESMRRIAIQEQLIAHQQQEKEENEKIALFIQAQQRRAESLAIIQKKSEEAKLNSDQEKLKRLQELEAQIEENKVLRQQMKEQQLAEDKKIMNPPETELIDNIKKEIEEEYLQKNFKAEQRILRAQWRTQRYHLQEVRMEFLRNEQNSLQSDMKNVLSEEAAVIETNLLSSTESKNMVFPNLDGLPTWAKRSLLKEHNTETTDENRPSSPNEQSNMQKAASDSCLVYSSEQDSKDVLKDNLQHTGPISGQTELPTKDNECEQTSEKHDFQVYDQHTCFVENEDVTYEVKTDSETEITSPTERNCGEGRETSYYNNKPISGKQNEPNQSVVQETMKNSDLNYTQQEINIDSSVLNQTTLFKTKSMEKYVNEVTIKDPLSLYIKTNDSHTCLKNNELSPEENTLQPLADKSENTCSKNFHIESEKGICISNKPGKQLNKEVNVQSESGAVAWKSALRDHASNTVLKFRGRSIHGHSSDSTVQNLIYGQKNISSERKAHKDKQIVNDTEHLNTDNLKDIIMKDISILSSSCAHPYQKDFALLGDLPLPDLVSNLPVSSEMGSTQDSDDDIACCQYNFLPVLLHRCLLPPLLAQMQIVNTSILDYFLINLNINSHFVALRNFFFFQDGEFGQSLSHLLFEKISFCQKPSELLNPLALSSILTQALAFSIYGDHPLADNLSFAIRSIPSDFPHNVSGILSYFELRYKVEWPCNIVITEQNVDYYNKIFGLLLQVKRALWSLTDIWFHLKRTARFHGLDNSPQYRQLQLCRHEMQHFARVVQSYIASQILQVTWQEFQMALQQKVHTLDDLREAHASYLKRACFRCLLSKKAAPVMKIIQDIFNLILKFHSKLILSSWQKNPDNDLLEHPSFHSLVASYKIFKRYSGFLYKVMKKLVARRYQLHLQEFLGMFDFNDYYWLEESENGKSNL